MELENNVLTSAEGKYIANVQETEFFLTMVFPFNTEIHVEDYHEVDEDYALAKLAEIKSKQKETTSNFEINFWDLDLMPDEFLSPEEAEAE